MGLAGELGKEGEKKGEERGGEGQREICKKERDYGEGEQYRPLI